MNESEYVMLCLGEECLEVGKECSKVLRFGPDDRHPDGLDNPTSLEKLVDELNDILGVVDVLVERGQLPADWCSAQKRAQKGAKLLGLIEIGFRNGTVSAG